jgi:adenosine deaminase
MELETFVRALPKVELHLHLEGAVAADTVINLAKKHGIKLPDFGTHSDIYHFSDLAAFLKVYDIVCSAIRDSDDFHRVTYEALKRCADAGVRYVEFFFSPVTHLVHGITYSEMLDGILAGMRDAERDLKIVSRLIPAHNRELGPAPGLEFFEMVQSDRRENIIGIGLDYLEEGFPPAQYQELYRRAKAAGLHATAHAGESGPASNIRDSISLLGCERIDHGYHIVDEPDLVAACRTSGMGFTCCPSTTMYTTIWRDLDAADHPIRRMAEAGLTVTLNTDDPALFRTQEYLIGARNFGFDRKKLGEIALNGLKISWLDDSTKRGWTAAWSREIEGLLKN